MKKVIINDKGKVDQGVSKTDNKIHSKIKGKDPSIKYIKKKKGKQRKTKTKTKKIRPKYKHKNKTTHIKKHATNQTKTTLEKSIESKTEVD